MQDISHILLLMLSIPLILETLLLEQTWQQLTGTILYLGTLLFSQKCILEPARVIIN